MPLCAGICVNLGAGIRRGRAKIRKGGAGIQRGGAGTCRGGAGIRRPGYPPRIPAPTLHVQHLGGVKSLHPGALFKNTWQPVLSKVIVQKK